MMKKTLLLSLLTLAVGASAQVTNIAYLRSLVDANYAVTNTTDVFTAQGVVTTHATLSAGNGLFYFQDLTGGMAVFMGGGAATNPAAGDNVTVTGSLGQFRGLQQFTSPAALTLVTNSSGNPLPAAVQLDFNQLTDPAYMEVLEGSYIVISNIVFDQSSTTFATSQTVTITNEIGQTFVMFSNGGTDIPGKLRPVGPATIFGVLGQFDTTSPYTAGYQIIPSRYADIIPTAFPPIVKFTNTLSNLVYPGDAEVSTSLTEYPLRPGETLTIETLSYDVDGSNITIYPVTTGLPTGANWSFGSTNGTDLPATFTYTPVSGSAGTEFDFTLVASSPRGTNTSVWTVYVPTAQEQKIVISEFLANPTSDTNSLYFNPLNRPSPGSTNAFKDDEFVEIVNLNGSPVELAGWSFGNSLGIRHTFYDLFEVGASNTAVLYGGELNSDPVPPSIPGMSAAFSDSPGGGVLFNNGDDTINLFNDLGNLVARVAFNVGGTANGISQTRFPSVTSDFVETASVVCTNVSPGLQPDQRAYTLPPITATQPTITGIADQQILVNTASPALAFTVGDAVTPVGSLSVSGASSNPGLVPNANITFGGAGASRTVTVTPAVNMTGVATITVSVGNAAFLCASTNFQILVQGTNAPVALFCDDFTYADGSLITNSAFVWTNHSGTVGQMQVAGGKAQVTSTQSEDVHAVIPGLPASGNLYYSLTVNFSVLPTAGDYFVHYKDDGNNFRARLWAQTNGAAAGQFRLGIANTSTAGDVVQFPQDLSLGTTYRATVRHSLDGGESTLWLDAANEGDPSVTTTDGSAPIPLTQIALRQDPDIGTLEADDLCVGTAFASVIPTTLQIRRQGGTVVLTWGDLSFNLQAAPFVTGTYTNVTGATSPYTNAVGGNQTYFRLIKNP